MSQRSVAMLLLLFLAGRVAPAAAQGVVRCGSAYGDQPCPGGQVVPVADPRSEEQRAQAGAVAARDARMARALEAARLKAEEQSMTAAAPQRTERRTSGPAQQQTLAKPAALFKAVAARKPADKPRARKSSPKPD